MTTEEKARAYDEALDRCKEWASGTLGHSVDDSPKDIAEFIFPELSESEDERIRKEIMHHISLLEYNRFMDASKEECLAYLEKQKEQKPAEWSGEDERIRKAILGFLNPDKGGTKYSSYAELVKWSNWLKSLHPQPQGIYQQVVKSLCDMCDRYEQNGVFTDERARDFLGNIRIKCKDAIECAPILDESHWKPSEEHLSALLAVLNDPNNIGSETCHLALTDLYEQLKKLV